MRVQCPKCASGGNIPDEKIPASGRKIVCPKCKTSFFVAKETELEDAQTTGPNALAFYQEGVRLLKGKQVDAAIEKFNAAIQKNPEYSDAYRYLGIAYGQKKLWEEASQVLQKAIMYKPDDLMSLKNLGIAYLRQNRFSDAEPVLHQALQYAPDDEKVKSFLKIVDRGKQQAQQTAETEQASSPSEIASVEEKIPSNLPTMPHNPVQEFLDKGTEFLENAQYNKAIEAFEEAARLAPNSSDGYFGLGMVYEQRQEWAKAFTAYQKAVNLNPDDSLAKENLRFAKKQKKKFRFPWKRS